MTTLARTLFDLSAVVRTERVARAIDTALARKQVTLIELSRTARDLGARGRRKSTVVRNILIERGEDFVAPASELEHEFVALIETSNLPQPARQVDLGDDDGWIGRVDFVYRDERIVIETDGREHHSSLLDRRVDAERDRRLRASGWTVLRFGWVEVVHDPKRTVARIARARELSLAPGLPCDLEGPDPASRTKVGG